MLLESNIEKYLQAVLFSSRYWAPYWRCQLRGFRLQQLCTDLVLHWPATCRLTIPDGWSGLHRLHEIVLSQTNVYHLGRRDDRL